MPRHLTNGTPSTNPALGFGAWRHPSATQSCLVCIEVTNDPSGVTASVIEMDVDEESSAGSEVADYSYQCRAPAGLGGTIRMERTLWIPAGGAYRIRNVSDPDSGNAITIHREVIL